MTIAIENPPEEGEYRVFNQFEEVYDLTELARKVQAAGNEAGLDVTIRNTENPRMELEEHYYNPDHQHLIDLGYKPTRTIDEEIRHMLKDLIKYRNRIESKKHALIPDIFWDGSRRKVAYL
jgi:UDP-sulfoquinovose synthase